jgi:hypothetical protein
VDKQLVNQLAPLNNEGSVACLLGFGGMLACLRSAYRLSP